MVGKHEGYKAKVKGYILFNLADPVIGFCLIANDEKFQIQILLLLLNLKVKMEPTCVPGRKKKNPTKMNSIHETGVSFRWIVESTQ